MYPIVIRSIATAIAPTIAVGGRRTIKQFLKSVLASNSWKKILAIGGITVVTDEIIDEITALFESDDSEIGEVDDQISQLRQLTRQKDDVLVAKAKSQKDEVTLSRVTLRQAILKGDHRKLIRALCTNQIPQLPWTVEMEFYAASIYDIIKTGIVGGEMAEQLFVIEYGVSPSARALESVALCFVQSARTTGSRIAQRIKLRVGDMKKDLENEVRNVITSDRENSDFHSSRRNKRVRF